MTMSPLRGKPRRWSTTTQKRALVGRDRSNVPIRRTGRFLPLLRFISRRGISHFHNFLKETSNLYDFDHVYSRFRTPRSL